MQNVLLQQGRTTIELSRTNNGYRLAMGDADAFGHISPESEALDRELMADILARLIQRAIREGNLAPDRLRIVQAGLARGEYRAITLTSLLSVRRHIDQITAYGDADSRAQLQASTKDSERTQMLAERAAEQALKLSRQLRVIEEVEELQAGAQESSQTTTPLELTMLDKSDLRILASDDPNAMFTYDNFMRLTEPPNP